MINEQVYGSRDNWIVPTSRTEQGTSITGMPSYDNTIDEINRVKIANYNTLESPRTLMRTQMSEDSHAGGYVINNNWLPTQTDTMDKSIVQFGIGPQSGLSNIEWWGEVWTGGETQPETGSHNNVKIINTDTYDITNIAFAFNNTFRPSLYATSGSMAGNGNMNPANWQYLNMQLWGDSRCFYSSQIDVVPQSAYAFTSLITQIPIKNIKIYPVIRAYNSQMQSKEYSSVQDYLANKTNYPFIYCIYAKFTSNTGDAWAPIDVSPWFFNITNIAKGFSNSDLVRNENIMYLRTRDLSGGFFVIGGCPNFNSQSYYQTNGFYWHYNTSTAGYNVAELMPVYQPEDLKFEYDTAKNAFVCDVSAMSDDDITEGIRKQLASFGLFFVDDIGNISEPLDSDKTFLGILENGVAYGKYSNGAKNREQDQWNWDSMEENSYDPDNPPTPSPFIPDPNGYNDGMSLSQLNGFETATQRYNLYKAQAHQVFAALWSVWDPFDESDPDLNTAQIDLKTKKMFLTNNPLDCVIGLKYFPVPADMIGSGSDTPVKLGALTLHQAGSSSVEIQCKMAQNSYIHDCGSVYCAPQYQAYSGISDSWIDQYVGFELYLPFCGSVKLDTATYIGKWVNVQYHIDYITGACTAYIGIPSAVNRSVSEFMEIRSGNCAIDVPISGIQQATLEANMFNATQQLKGAALKGVSSVVGNLISTAGKAAAKDIGGAVSAGFSTVGSIAGSVNEIQSAKFELQHTQLPARMIGSASALSGAEGYLSPMLIVTEPRLIEVPDNYGHTVGFACMRYGKLKDISSGYTEINSIDLDGIACTAEEKSIIRSVLAGGIYV